MNKNRKKRLGIKIHAKSKKNKANEDRNLARTHFVAHPNPAAALMAYYSKRAS